MGKERNQILSLVVLLAVLCLGSTTVASAQDGSAILRCPKKPINIKLYTRALQQSIRDQIDTTLYDKVRARIKFRLQNRNTDTKSVNVSDILTGLSASVTGLSPMISGSLTYTDTCDYTYVVTVAVSATEIATGARLSSSTQSTVTLTTTGNSQAVQFFSGDEESDSSPSPSPSASASPSS